MTAARNTAYTPPRLSSPLSPGLSASSSSLSSPSSAGTCPLTTPTSTTSLAGSVIQRTSAGDDDIVIMSSSSYNNGDLDSGEYYGDYSNNTSLGSFLAEVDEWLVNINRRVAELESRHKRHFSAEAMGGLPERELNTIDYGDREGTRGSRVGMGTVSAVSGPERRE